MKLARLVCALLTVVLVVTSAAWGLNVREKRLDNGLQIYVAENHSSPVFTMRVYVKAGSIYEDEYLGCGISHYVEHLVSGGTTYKRTEAESERILRAIGGAHNAYTTSDHTCYFISTSIEYADSVIDLLSDWVLNCAFDPKAVEREKGVITREIAMGMDEPYRRLGKLYNGAMFEVHPEHYPTIGYLELFKQLERDDVVKYYKRMYVPSNMFVVAVGDFNADEMLERIGEAFAGYEYKAPPRIFLPSDPKQMGMRYVEDEMDVGVTYMTMGWRTVRVDNDDVYPLHVMASILGEGRSSRLYRKVKEDLGLVHTISASSYNPQYDAADFTVHATCDFDKLAEAQKAIKEVVYGLKRGRISRAELEKAKNQILSDLAFGMQGVEDQAATIGRNVLRTGNPNYTDFYIERIKAVTADDIRRVANTYFYDDALTVAVVKPQGAGGEEIAKVAAEKEVSEVSRIVLPNGITLLLKEDHNVPLVHFRTRFLGGSYLEDESTNGSFYLAARMLRRGTRRRDAEDIAREIDRLGATLYPITTEDYFGCDLDIISDNFAEGLDLLADVIVNSTFPEDEFTKERDNLIALIKQRKDDWQTDAEIRLRKLLYGNHPYGFDPYGTEASVERLERDYVYRIYQTYCVPSNMVLAVFGDIDRDETRQAIERAFGRFRRKCVQIPPVPAWNGIPDDIEKVEYHDKQQAVITLAFPGMDISSKDWYAMRVLDAIISGIGYPGGWLHETLRGQQLVYFVHAWNVANRGRGYFTVLAATAPATADSALKIIREKIARIKQDYVSDEELETAKRICKIMEDLYYYQTPAAQAGMAAMYEALGLGYDYRLRLKDEIDAVTKEDVRRVAQKYLTHSATLIVRPQGE